MFEFNGEYVDVSEYVEKLESSPELLEGDLEGWDD